MTISTASTARAGSDARRHPFATARLPESFAVPESFALPESFARLGSFALPGTSSAPAVAAPPRRDVQPDRTTTAQPAAVAVDLGSGYTRVWAAARPTLTAPTTGEVLRRPVPLLRRGRIIDVAGCISLLTRMLGEHRHLMPERPVVVACRPVLASLDDQAKLRRVLTDVFEPSRILLVDTVLAAAMGVGAASGALLVVDIGQQLTEVACLANGRVTAARRVDLGTRDLALGIVPGLLAEIVARLARDLLREPAGPGAVLVVGGGAETAELTAQLAASLRIPVRAAATPHSAAVTGAGLAAMAAARHPAVS